MKLIRKTIIGIFGLTCTIAQAGYFDCSVIYDEYESLMASQFLVEPDRYVPTLRDKISRSEYEKLQKNTFKLHSERIDRGVAVFHTNSNLYGKFLFLWTEPLPDQPPHVLIEYGAVYGRVVDGFAPVFFVPLRLKPGASIDLDMGRVIPPSEKQSQGTKRIRGQADIEYRIDKQTNEPYLQAVNSASLQYPIESLCHRPSANTNQQR